MPPLGIDCAWAKPPSGAVRNAGYEFVIGYLSTDPSKNLTPDNIDAYQAQNLGILLVWETTANRALAGMAAGMQDARDAVKQAQALGYPSSCPIFFACDTNANPMQVRPYFRGVSTIYPNAGAYGSLAVVDDMLDAGIVRWGWQTCAWSNNEVSTKAHLYQRLKPTLPLQGSFDEDVMLRPVPLFTKPVVQPAQPNGALRLVPFGDDDMPYVMRTPDTEIDLVAGTVIHLEDEAAVEFYTSQGIKEFNFRQQDGDVIRKAAQQ